MMRLGCFMISGLQGFESEGRADSRASRAGRGLCHRSQCAVLSAAIWAERLLSYADRSRRRDTRRGGLRVIETEGWLSEVALRDGALRVEGWVASRGAGSLDELRILTGGEALPGGQLTRGLPRPHAAAGHPRPGAGGAAP